MSRQGRRGDFESSMSKELAFHLEQATQDYIAQGLTPEEARRRARREFGALDLAKEELRDTQLTPLRRYFDEFAQDLGQFFRNSRASPAHAAVAIGVLALGLGVNAVVFTAVDAALFRGYAHVPASGRLVQITTSITNTLYYPDYQVWQKESRSLQGLALVRGVFHTIDTGANTPETLFTAQVTSGTFRMLGVRPFLGRDFTATDEQAGAAAVVILRFDVWARYFASSPAAIGQKLILNGSPATIIGVMPKGFSFPWSQSLWTPMIPTPGALARQSGYARYAIGRLAPGQTLASARADIESISARLSAVYPKTNADIRPILASFEDWYIGRRNLSLYRITWAAVIFLLIMICANVANLMVGQAVSRSREIAVRLALGAGRPRIIRGFLVESLALSTVGGATGLAAAYAFLRLYPSIEVSEVVLDLSLNLRVTAYLAALIVLASLSASAGAALYLSRLHARGAPTYGRGATEGRSGRRVSHALVALETAAAMALLSGAAVLGRSFLNVQQADLGINMHNLFHVDAYSPRLTDATARRRFYRDLLARVSAIPGVESAAYGDVPGYDATPHHYHFAGQPARPASALPSVPLLYSGPGYFETLGARLLAGRAFTQGDVEAFAPVVIINQRFAEQYWPGQSALGKTFRVLPAFPGEPILPWLTVVGVASNIMQNDRTRQSFVPLVYVPTDGGQLMLRTRVAPALIAPVIKREIHAAAPDLPAPIWPMDELLALNYAFERNITTLFLTFAAASLAIAVIGLFAALSRALSQRTQELGIRMAVGAAPRHIWQLTLRQGLEPVLVGLAIGLVLSVAGNQLLRAQLVATSPSDPLSLVAAAACLLSCAGVACYLPARRAAAIDPAISLRHD